jgi:hypothetical protein
MRSVVIPSIHKILMAIGLLWMSIPSAFANQWAPSVGEAKEVQFRTRDIVDRSNRLFPYCPVAQSAMILDNSACQLVESVKCGASWEQVQMALARTCSLAGQLNSIINADCEVRNDRRTRDYMLDLSKRIERLRCSLDKDFARTQPSFCPPSRLPHNQYRPQIGVLPPMVPSVPNHRQPYHVPSPFHPFPGSTYDFDNHPFEASPNESQPFGAPSIGPDESRDFLPPGSQIGPIQYRVRNEAPRNSQRAIAVAQLGLEVLRLFGN